jgi:hypothetical protein
VVPAGGPGVFELLLDDAAEILVHR